MVSKANYETQGKICDREQWFSIVKGTIYAITISLILIVLLAVAIWLLNIPESFILPINQVIKIISLFLGCFIGLKGCNKGLIKGMLIGGIYSILSYAIFSLLCGVFTFGLTSLTDLIFSVLMGGICGMLAVNFTRRR